MKTGARNRFVVFAVITLIASAVAGGFLVWPRATPNQLSIAFVGYTNNSMGDRFALFAFTNVYDRAIGFRVVTETKTPSGWPAFISGSGLPHQPPDIPVEARSNSLFTISVPTNNAAWRVWMLYDKTTTKRDDILFGVRRFFYSMHMDFIANRIECEK